METYGSARPRVVEAVIGSALRLGAQFAIIERRYLDADYRNEHSRFYSSTFRRYPSVAHRLHFFADPPPEALRDPSKPADLAGLQYLGYVVLRPLPAAPVGRTMLAVPTGMRDDVTVTGTDRVNVLGVDLEVTGAPFMAQDGQLSRCAHTTTWVASYLHHLAFGSPRHLPGEVANAVESANGFGRSLPSPGLTVAQMAETSRAVGLPPLVYLLDQLPVGETVPRVVCRYLNSGMPVIVTAGQHAFVLVGYGRTRSPTGEERLHFIRQDDERGPYQRVDHWLLDSYGVWQAAIVPLPPKVYLAGEEAEAVGLRKLEDALAASSDPRAVELAAALARHDVSPRTSVLPSNAFKRSLRTRGLPAIPTAVYQRMQLSRWVWVVELTDRQARDRREPCVLAEAVIDATDHQRDPQVLAWRVPGAIWRWDPDADTVSSRTLDDAEPVLPVARPSSWTGD